MSMKKPFGNIGKLKKDKPIQQPVMIKESREQKNYQVQNMIQRPPTGKLKLNVNKEKGSIYDAVRKVDQQKQAASISNNVHKPALSFKKNRLAVGGLKGQKNQGGIINSDLNRPREQFQQQSTQNLANLPRPTPVFNRQKGKLLMGKSKQKPVIQKQQPEEKPIGQYLNKNRLAEMKDQQQQQNQQEKSIKQQQSKKHIKPNLFKSMGEKKKLLNNSPQQNPKPSQRLLNNSQIYQQYQKTADGKVQKQKFNYQKMMNIQNAQINIQRKVQQVSLYKIQKQSKRTKQLSQLLNLQIDLYEELTSISSTTPFEVYISKIKAGVLKNSCDEAFDHKNQVSCQTSSNQYIDFSNQCPQDYQIGHGLSYQQNSQNHNFDQFILKFSPLIQQLIKPSKQIVMPPTSLLAFHPVFKKFIKCPSPTFVYYSEAHNLSLVAIGQKLYINQDEIECALDMGGTKIAGLKNGRIVLWNGQNDRGSQLYSKIRQMIESQNFELPAYVTNDFDRLSPYLCQGSITSLLSSQQQNSFYSFDSTSKLIKWSIQKSSRKTILQPKQIYQFSKILQKKHLIGLGLKKRNQIFYLYTSSGIICWNGESITQKLEVRGIKDFYLMKRSNLVICLTEFNSIQIFSIENNEYLDQIRLNIAQQITQIIIPQLEHENRQISIFYQLYLSTQSGTIYQIRIIDKQYQIKKLSSSSSRTQPTTSTQQPGSKSKRTSSSIIYHGINTIGNTVQKIKLYKDLKCTTQIIKLDINLSNEVNNLKAILMKNKQFNQMLNQKNSIFV